MLMANLFNMPMQDAAVSLRSREFFAESILVTADAEERVSGRLQSYGELQKLIVMQRMEVQMAAAPSELGREAAQELAVTGMTEHVLDAFKVAWRSNCHVKQVHDSIPPFYIAGLLTIS